MLAFITTATTVENWGSAVFNPLQDLSQRTVNALPSIIGAIIILAIGWLVSATVGKIVTKIIELVKIDKAFEKIGIKKAAEESGMEFSMSKLFGWLIKWFLLLVFFLAATNILGLNQVANFINDILRYIPNVIVAVLILMVGTLFADFLYRLVRSGTKATGIPSASFLASVAKWTVLIFSTMVALAQLKIALVETLFTGIVAMFAIAGGIAFGLGGKDLAKELLEKVKQDISKNGKETKKSELE
ncbi:hypothetical protein COY23_01045 [bacterium (Candidatus Torokbacteria) CG_4_10_14_0_2_um_filter_35_8]|nr:MAG: hypothetical protein COY23_01045 [bacterium (Candidatus Torokbacteria) CG_4_10_14_0_2_um_filter_35_8]